MAVASFWKYLECLLWKKHFCIDLVHADSTVSFLTLSEMDGVSSLPCQILLSLLLASPSITFNKVKFSHDALTK